MKKINKITRFLFSLLLIVAVAGVVTFVTNDTSLFFKAGAVLLAIGFVKGLVNYRSTPGIAYQFVISDTTYAGEALAQFIVQAITGADTVNSGSVYVKDGIKKKFTIPRWNADYEDLIQDRAATPTSKGTMTITGQVLEPADYMIYNEFNPRDFEDQWMAVQLDPTLLDRSLPPSAESVTVQGVMARHAKYMNKALWVSDTSLASPSIYRYFDGFIKKALNSADTIDVASPTTLTVSNIQAEMLKGYNAIPLALRYDPNMKFFVSYATYDLYEQSQVAQTYKGVDITQQGKDTFKGKKVVKIADFPDDVYMIAKGAADMSSNLWVGMNSTSDETLKLSQLQANSEYWFIKLLMKLDVQFGWNGEVVLYHS